MSNVPPMEDGKFYHMIRRNTQQWFSPASTCMTTDRPAKLRTCAVHFLKSRSPAGRARPHRGLLLIVVTRTLVSA